MCVRENGRMRGKRERGRGDKRDGGEGERKLNVGRRERKGEREVREKE